MKKLISILMSALMLFGVMAPCAAATEKSECDCGFNPVIYVGALGCSDIVRDAGTENEQTLWKIDTGYLLSCIAPQLPTIAKAALTLNADTFADALIAFVDDCFGDLTLDGNGQSLPNVNTPYLNVPTGSEHHADCDYYFDYDFRLDPFAHADRLQEFIDQVEELTGHSKVQLKASSMGGVVLSAYLQKYGHSEIETIITQCCPLKGTAVAGELFCGKFELNATALRRYAQDALPYMDGGDFIQAVLYSLTDALRVAGVWELLIGMGDIIVAQVLDRIYDEALIPIFGSFAGIWAFVPEEYYEDALVFMGLNEDTGDLYNQVENYRVAMANIEENLRKAQSDGVKTYILCGYNVQRTPLVSAWKNTSDGTVDTMYASVGATCALYGEELTEEYIASLTDTKYLSPDKMIDASTCALPDNTWFLRDWLHCNGNDAIGALYRIMLTTDKQLTVFDMEDYPQYLQNDDATPSLTPVTGAPNAFENFKNKPSALNFVLMFSAIIDMILAKLKEMITNIGG
ncbi:MAG: hypothetical protein IJC45_10165 [Clostridia bacterium]|nr:hypothetical protein [Clostridia bacterium]